MSTTRDPMTGQEFTDGEGHVISQPDYPGVWSWKTVNDPTNVVDGMEVPAGAVAITVHYTNRPSSAATGGSVGVAIGFDTQAEAETAINAGLVPFFSVDDAALELTLAESASITRVDWKTASAETGNSKIVIGWKVLL